MRGTTLIPLEKWAGSVRFRGKLCKLKASGSAAMFASQEILLWAQRNDREKKQREIKQTGQKERRVGHQRRRRCR